MPRLVLDTNVIVSALYGGRVTPLLDLWRDEAFLLCVSDAILAEYEELLARFVFPEPVQSVSADPDDDMFLACAVAAQADFIVSGDRHLLELGAFRGIRIVSPAEALDLLSE